MVITPDHSPSHGLDYEGGLVSTWNKLCVHGGGYIEVRSCQTAPRRPD